MTNDQKDVKADEVYSDTSTRLEALEKAIEAINKNRKFSAVTSYLGLIIIIITLSVFITNWLSFFNNYDINSLVKEIELRVPSLLDSKEAQNIYSTIQNNLVPQYSKELMHEFQNKAPLFAEDVMKEKENLAVYLQTNIRDRIAENMVNKLSDSEATNLAIYFQNKIPPEKLERITHTVHNVIQEKLTSELNKQLTPAVAQLHDINDCFEALYENMEREGEFKNMTPETVGEIENRFIEALLESIIFELNPQKGNLPVLKVQ